MAQKNPKQEHLENSITTLRLHMEGMMRGMQLALQELAALQNQTHKKRPKISPMEFRDANGKVYRI